MHKYGEGISFYYITKNEFNELLDLVKQLAPEEYKDEAKDDFYQLVAYWNEAGRSRFELQVDHLKNRLARKN